LSVKAVRFIMLILIAVVHFLQKLVFSERCQSKMSMPLNGLDQQKSLTSKECSSKDIKIASSQIWSP